MTTQLQLVTTRAHRGPELESVQLQSDIRELEPCPNSGAQTRCPLTSPSPGVSGWGAPLSPPAHVVALRPHPDSGSTEQAGASSVPGELPGTAMPGVQSASGIPVELIEAARAGDVTAQQRLFERSWARVRALVHRLVPCDRELDDLVQEIFIEALVSLPRLREPAAWDFWLRGLAVRVVRSRLRRRKLQRLLGLWSPSEPSSFEALISPTAPPDVATDLRAVYAALEALDSDCRIALVLRHVEHMSVPEVASHLNLSLSTVKRRLATAEGQLQLELSRQKEAR